MLSPQNHVSSETNKEEDGRQSSLRLTVSAWPRDATQSASILCSLPGAQPRPTNTYCVRNGIRAPGGDPGGSAFPREWCSSPPEQEPVPEYKSYQSTFPRHCHIRRTNPFGTTSHISAPYLGLVPPPGGDSSAQEQSVE